MTSPANKAAIARSKPKVKVTGANANELLRLYRGPLQASFERSAHGMVFSARVGGDCRTTVVTNSREDAAGYRLLEERSVQLSAPDWPMLRSIPLPALRTLSVSQAMAVREEAEKALPAFQASFKGDLE